MQQKFEYIQYNVALAITRAIRGTSREKIDSELGLELLQDKCWYRKLCAFYKILTGMSPKYLSDSIVWAKKNYFLNTFFLPTITEWNKFDLSIHNSTSLSIFEGRLLNFAKPLENSVYTCHNPIGIYLRRLKLGFNHLCYHKFKPGFLDAVDLLCSCSSAIKNTVHYFLHCPNFSTAWNTGRSIIVDRSLLT